MNEMEKFELQQEISTLKKQQGLFLKLFEKFLDQFNELEEILNIEAKKGIIRCQQTVSKKQKR
jgi:hypothetical protein